VEGQERTAALVRFRRPEGCLFVCLLILCFEYRTQQTTHITYNAVLTY
jgi:hypothetical protein